MSSWLAIVASIALLFGAGTAYLTGRTTPAALANFAIALLGFGAAGFSALRAGKRLPAGIARRAWIRALVEAALAIFASAVLLALASRVDYRFDLTRIEAYTLSFFTESVLSRLVSDIDAIVVGTPSADLSLLLDRYETASPRFHVRLVPSEAMEGEGGRQGGRSRVMLQGGGRMREVSWATERYISQALQEFVDRDGRVFCFVTGHGEAETRSASDRSLAVFRRAIEREGFVTRELLLAASLEVPRDCAVVVLAAPARPLLAEERGRLTAHFEEGGRLLVFLEPDHPSEPRELLDAIGIRPLAARIVDRDSRALGDRSEGLEPLVNLFTDHPIAEGLGPQTRVLFSGVRPLELSGPRTLGFVWSSRASHTTPLADDTDDGVAASDVLGPLALGASVQRVVESGVRSGESRVVVFGDLDFATNRYLGLLYNEDLALNAALWLASRDDLIDIRPKAESLYQVLLTPEKTLAAFHSLALLLPEIVLILGVSLWWRRRRL